MAYGVKVCSSLLILISPNPFIGCLFMRSQDLCIISCSFIKGEHKNIKRSRKEGDSHGESGLGAKEDNGLVKNGR